MAAYSCSFFRKGKIILQNREEIGYNGTEYGNDIVGSLVTTLKSCVLLLGNKHFIFLIYF